MSVRRPRETLAGINANAMSAIPVPASAVKRSTSSSNLHQASNGGAFTHSRTHSGSRMSVASGLRPPPAQPVFARSSTNDATSSSHPRASIMQSARKPAGGVLATPARPVGGMMAMTTPGGAGVSSAGADMLARRSSYFGTRPSGAGGNGLASMGGVNTFFAAAPLAAGVPTDPRRLRDASVRQHMASELMEYLTRNNYETETGTGLTGKTLTSPTQKEFVTLFKWLYGRIDPGYKFQKNMDQEIPLLLKQLRYPFEKSITRSQIAAVGGNNWHTFLGLLHWLMQLASMMDSYVTGRYDYACVEAGLDVAADRIIFDFLSDAYRAWLAVDDDAADEDADRAVQIHVDRMAGRFTEINRDLLDDVDMLEAEKRALQEQIDELERGAEVGQKLDHKLQLIKDDNIKYEEWIAKVEQKIKRSGGKITLLEDEIKKVEDDIETAEKERSEHQDSLSRAGITIQDLDRMTTEMDRLEKSKNAILLRLDEVRLNLNEQETEASKKFDELERSIQQYNSQAYKIGLIPQTATNARGQTYELTLKVPNQAPSNNNNNNNNYNDDLTRSLTSTEPDTRLLADGHSTGYQPQQLLTVDIKGAVRANLQTLRRDISERRNQALEEDLKNRSLLDKVNEALEDKQTEVEALANRIRVAEEEHERTKETLGIQKMGVDAQIERLEKELAKLRQGVVESVQMMEQREINTNIEFEQLNIHAANLREELHTAIEGILNDVIHFKIHIQKKLEDYEQFVEDEVNAEARDLENSESELLTNQDDAEESYAQFEAGDVDMS